MTPKERKAVEEMDEDARILGAVLSLHASESPFSVGAKVMAGLYTCATMACAYAPKEQSRVDTRRQLHVMLDAILTDVENVHEAIK